MKITITMDETKEMLKSYLSEFHPVNGHQVTDIEIGGYGDTRVFVVSFERTAGPGEGKEN